MSINEHLWEFPHAMALKVMGERGDDFRTAVVEILETHFEDFDADTLAEKPSSSGKYLSLTVHVVMRDKAHVEAVYRALHECPHVKLTF